MQEYGDTHSGRAYGSAGSEERGKGVRDVPAGHNGSGGFAHDFNHAQAREIFNAVESNTVIFISHRMASTRFSDKVLVLDQAKLVEMGTHQELLKNNKLYAEMFHQQADYYI